MTEQVITWLVGLWFILHMTSSVHDDHVTATPHHHMIKLLDCHNLCVNASHTTQQPYHWSQHVINKIKTVTECLIYGTFGRVVTNSKLNKSGCNVEGHNKNYNTDICLVTCPWWGIVNGDLLHWNGSMSYTRRQMNNMVFFPNCYYMSVTKCCMSFKKLLCTKAQGK